MKVLVTGSAGFIGSNLANALIKKGHKVTGIDDLSLGKPKNISHLIKNPNFKFIKADAANFNLLKKVFKKHRFDLVFHMAANSLVFKSLENLTLDLNKTFLTTVCVLRCMKEFKVKKMVFASSSAVYGKCNKPLKENMLLNPISIYGAAKAASENYINAFCASFNIQAVILRFANVAGPGLTHGVIYDFIAKLNKNPKELLILGNGKQTKPYIHIDDLIKAIFLTVKKSKKPLEIFNIGVKTFTSVNQIAKMIIKAKRLKKVKLKYTGGCCGWKGDIAKFKYNLSKINKLGWKPKLTSNQAVKLAIKQNICKQL
jgi:UDP-glucose 4-epimerase